VQNVDYNSTVYRHGVNGQTAARHASIVSSLAVKVQSLRPSLTPGLRSPRLPSRYRSA